MTESVCPDRLLKFTEVYRMTGLSRPTIWRYEKASVFPKRRRIGAGNRVAWLESEVIEWINSRTIVA